MGRHARLMAAILIMLMAVGVDFTSKLLSVMSDGFLMAALAVVVWPLVNSTNKAP